MQCGLVALITCGFAVLAVLNLRRSETPNSSRWKHKEALVSGLVEFHKAQCYFSVTLQIASLVYGPSQINNVMGNIMLLPLATNGVLPIVFAYILIVRYGRTSTYITILTLVTWVLSSLVFWTLYRKLIPTHHASESWEVYAQFLYDLSANPSCGGSSALAVCPENLEMGLGLVTAAVMKIYYYPPFVWTWPTLCLIVTVALQYVPKLWEKKGKPHRVSELQHNFEHLRNGIRSRLVRAILTIDGLFWFTMLVFTLALGFHLSLLSIEDTLNMMDPSAWGFGQIVAVTVWVPPIVEYLHLLIRKCKEYQKASDY
jgi:hypothetical protein